MLFQWLACRFGFHDYERMPRKHWVYERPPQDEEELAVFQQYVDDGFASICELCIWRERGIQHCVYPGCTAVRTVERHWVEKGRHPALANMIQPQISSWHKISA